MNEKVSEKKGVSRTVAIALGIICIILAVGLVTVVVMLSNTYSTITEKDDIISYKDNEISARDNLIQIKEDQINSLTNITLLQESAIWFSHETTNQPANGYSAFGRTSVNYRNQSRQHKPNQWSN